MQKRNSYSKVLLVLLFALMTAAPFTIYRSISLADTSTQLENNIETRHKFGKFKISPTGGMFVRFQDGDQSVCRTATQREKEEFERQAQTENLRIITPIRPKANDGLTIILRATPQLEQFPEAKAAFLKAAATWESLIKTKITITIDVDFGPNRFGTPFPAGVIGSTRSQDIIITPDAGSDISKEIRDILIETASSPSEKTLYNSLPTNSLLTDIGNAVGVVSPSAGFRAIGVLDPIPDLAQEEKDGLGKPPAISFNSNFTYDFDPSNGIDTGKTDFDAVAIHEIGHALGFVSSTGVNELVPSQPVAPTIWDIFRFRPGITSSSFTTANRILSSGGDQVFFAGGAQIPLSTGRPDASGGDRNQASHWKDDDIVKQYIGIMDPTAPSGKREEITANDLLALDTFGYTLSTPVTLDTTPPKVTDVTPKGGESLTVGNTASITWMSSDDKALGSHTIAMSTDGGQTFSVSVATGLAATAKSFTWLIPTDAVSTSARIRVTATDTAFNKADGISAGNFTIKPQVISGALPPTNLTATVVDKTVQLAWQPPVAPALKNENHQIVQPSQAPATLIRPTGIPAGKFADLFLKGVTSGNKDVFGEQLTPTSYPATLKSVLYLSQNSRFKSNATGNPFPSAAGAKMKLYVFNALTGANLSGGTPTNLKTFDITIQKEPADFKNVVEPSDSSAGDFNEFVIPDYTITSGSFFVALQLVDPGTSSLSASGRDFLYLVDGQAPSTAIISEDGKSFDGVGFQYTFSDGSSLSADFPFLGRVTTAASGGNLTGYNIYRSIDAPVVIAAINKVGSVDKSTTKFTDSPANADGKTTYKYVVTAVYNSQTESSPSNEVSATPGFVDKEAPIVKVTAPNGGETVISGGKLNIAWTATDNVGVTIQTIDLSTNGGTSFDTQIATGLASDIKTFTFDIPATLSSITARIRVTAKDGAGNTGQDTSDANFSIVLPDKTAPTVKVLFPNKATDKFKANSTAKITWESSDNVGVVSQDVLLSTDGGTTFSTTIASGLAGTVKSFDFAVPKTQAKSKTARIRVVAKDAAGNIGQDDSDENFVIKPKK